MGWLNLERADERILLQYSSLRGYFLSENAPESATNSNGVESEWGAAKRFRRLEKAFEDPMIEDICIFSVVYYLHLDRQIFYYKEKILAFTWCIVNSIDSYYN